MEASLTCAVCLSLFEEPVTLPLCSHNFCRGCVLECLASAEATRLQQPRGQGQARLSRGGPGPSGGGGGEASGVRVSCPLCRKLCPLPRGGAAALPVNTTLAEVVKLYRSGAVGAAKAEEAEPGPGLLALGGACQKHPSRLVQLYCRMCRQAGCGQCVSEEHQGVFHSVNLIDTVYQEEKSDFQPLLDKPADVSYTWNRFSKLRKLNFFCSLKKMRLINEKLMNEIASQPSDMDMLLNYDAATIELEFGEIFKTLGMKKRQLLEEIENQRSKKEKEFQIWKKMKETHKRTVESFLKDCENLVHECDPQRFLEVACGLNTRMKTQLDLMNIASSYEKAPDRTKKKMDIQPVVNEISALKLVPVNVGSVKDLPSGGKEDSAKNPLFNSATDQWQKNIPSTFLPVAGQEETLADGSRICTRLMSVSGMAAFQNMSHEELRHKYYMGREKLSDDLKTQTLHADKKPKFVATEALNDRPSVNPFVTFSKANDTNKAKVGTLKKSNGVERGFSRTSHHGVPPTNTNSSERNGDFKSVHERSSQEVTTPASSGNSRDSAIKEESPVQASSVISSETDKNSSTSTDLKPAASVAAAASNSDLVGVSAERRSASPFAFSACDDSFPGPIKDTRGFSCKKKDRKYVFPQFYLGKCDHVDKTDNQDESKPGNQSPVTKATVSDASTSPNVGSADSKKPGSSFQSGSSEGGCWGGLGVTNTFEVLPLSSFARQSEKPSHRNTSSRARGKTLSAKETAGWDTQKPSALWEQKANTSKPSTSLAWGTSETTSAAGGKGFFPPLLSHECSMFTFGTSPLQSRFSFGCSVRNTSDSLTSSVFPFGNGTNTAEEEPVRCHEAPLNLGKATSLESTEPASRSNHPPCEGSPCPANSAKAPESADLVADGDFYSKSLISVVSAVKQESVPPPQPVAEEKEPEAKGKDEASRTVAENSCSWPGQGDEPASILLQSTACPDPGVSVDLSAGGSALSVPEAGGRPSNSDPDTEELSQTSVSTNSSSTSEYFSVAKDKIATRNKTEA